MLKGELGKEEPFTKTTMCLWPPMFATNPTSLHQDGLARSGWRERLAKIAEVAGTTAANTRRAKVAKANQEENPVVSKAAKAVSAFFLQHLQLESHQPPPSVTIKQPACIAALSQHYQRSLSTCILYRVPIITNQMYLFFSHCF